MKADSPTPPISCPLTPPSPPPFNITTITTRQTLPSPPPSKSTFTVALQHQHQLTHFSHNDCENMCTLSYHHQIRCMAQLPLFHETIVYDVCIYTFLSHQHNPSTITTPQPPPPCPQTPCLHHHPEHHTQLYASIKPIRQHILYIHPCVLCVFVNALKPRWKLMPTLSSLAAATQVVPPVMTKLVLLQILILVWYSVLKRNTWRYQHCPDQCNEKDNIRGTSSSIIYSSPEFWTALTLHRRQEWKDLHAYDYK